MDLCFQPIKLSLSKLDIMTLFISNFIAILSFLTSLYEEDEDLDIKRLRIFEEKVKILVKAVQDQERQSRHSSSIDERYKYAHEFDEAIRIKRKPKKKKKTKNTLKKEEKIVYKKTIAS